MAPIVPSHSSEPFGPQSVLVHYHTPKCGGMSLRQVLAKGFKHHWNFYGDTRWWLAVPEIQRAPGPVLISGHGVWGVHDYLSDDRNVFYVTMLRHPWDRLKSTYKFLRVLGRPLPNVSEFVLSGCTAARPQDNLLVRRFGDGELELAMERLETTFHSFGLVEQYDASVRLFSRCYGLSLDDAPRRNVTDSGTLECEQPVVDYFLEANAADLELYDWAAKLFSTRIRDHEDSTPQHGHPAPAGEAPAPLRIPHIPTSEIQRGDHDGAIDRLTAALRNGRRGKRLFDSLLALYERSGRYQEIAPLLLDAIACYPGRAASYLFRFHRHLDDDLFLRVLDRELTGLSQYNGGQPDGDHIRRYLVPLRLLPVKRLMIRGALGEALQACRDVHEAHPTDVRVVTTLCELMLYNGVPADVLDLLDTSDITPPSHVAYGSFEVMKAAASYALEQTGPALEHLANARKIWPDVSRILPPNRATCLASVITAGERVLLVPTGVAGAMQTHGLLRETAQLDVVTDVLGQAHVAGPLRRHPKVRKVFVLPYKDRRGSHHGHLDQGLSSQGYDAVIVAGVLRERCDGMVTLARQVRTGSLSVYPLEFYVDDTRRDQLLPLDLHAGISDSGPEESW